MSSKVTPCVTIMICVAGCSSTTTQDFPNTRNFPAPEFDQSEKTDPRPDAEKIKQQAERLRAAREEDDEARKPITVDVPLAVLEDKPPPSSVIATKFESVPDAYLKGIPTNPKTPPAKPFFTPLKTPVKAATQPAPPAPAPVKTAEAILKPLIEPASPEIAARPESIAYPTYISVGPEYFGLDSDIAPYVISRAPTAPPRPNRYAQAEPIAIRPLIVIAETERPLVVSGPIMPLPRTHPMRRGREQLPAWEVAALAPAPPDPKPRRIPTEPAPRIPVRTGSERAASGTPREDLIDRIERRREGNAPDDPSRQSGWSSSVERALADPAPAPIEAIEQPVYRVRVSPPEPAATDVASLDPTFQSSQPVPPADFSIVTSDELAADSLFAPQPRQKPRRGRDGLQVAGTVSGVTTKRLNSINTKPANDIRPPSVCLVNRGSNDRMILICEGVDVSKSDIFRSVVEGESAFRGLRLFDETPAVIDSYGFNPERFNAMSQGPRSARDLAFLRALRESRQQIRVKGRLFDLYLMKGDKRLATVLIEQVSEVEMPASIRAN